MGGDDEPADEYEPPNAREIGFRKAPETAKRFEVVADNDEWEPPNKREIGFRRKTEVTMSGEDLSNNSMAVRAGLAWSSDAKMEKTTEISKSEDQTQTLSRRARLGRMVEADAAAGRTAD